MIEIHSLIFLRLVIYFWKFSCVPCIYFVFFWLPSLLFLACSCIRDFPQVYGNAWLLTHIQKETLRSKWNDAVQSASRLHCRLDKRQKGGLITLSPLFFKRIYEVYSIVLFSFTVKNPIILCLGALRELGIGSLSPQLWLQPVFFCAFRS